MSLDFATPCRNLLMHLYTFSDGTSQKHTYFLSYIPSDSCNFLCLNKKVNYLWICETSAPNSLAHRYTISAGTIGRNLSVAACMDYTRLFQQLSELWQLRLSPYIQKNHIRRNLSVAACMDYTSPTTARMSEPRLGASCRAVVEISECNSYMSQRLDSLRRDFFVYKGTA